MSRTEASHTQAVHCVQGTYGTGSHAFSTISSSGALTLAQLWQNLNRSPDVMRAILDPCGQSDWLKKVMDDMSCGEDDAKWLQKQLLKFMALPFPYRLLMHQFQMMETFDAASLEHYLEQPLLHDILNMITVSASAGARVRRAQEEKRRAAAAPGYVCEEQVHVPGQFKVRHAAVRVEDAELWASSLRDSWLCRNKNSGGRSGDSSAACDWQYKAPEGPGPYRRLELQLSGTDISAAKVSLGRLHDPVGCTLQRHPVLGAHDRLLWLRGIDDMLQLNPSAARKILNEGFWLVGRHYTRLVTKDIGTDTQVVFAALSSLSPHDKAHDFLDAPNPEFLRNLVADCWSLGEAGGVFAKYAHRPALFLSPAQPTPLDPNAIRYVDNVYGASEVVATSGTVNNGESTALPGDASQVDSTHVSNSLLGLAHSTADPHDRQCLWEEASTRQVMTDGNGLICAEFARTLPCTTAARLPAPGQANMEAMLKAVSASLTPYTSTSYSATARDGSNSTGSGTAAVGEGVNACVQVRLYDPRVGAVIKGTFTPCTSLPAGVKLVVSRSQVKAPSLPVLLHALQQLPRTTAPAEANTGAHPRSNQLPRPTESPEAQLGKHLQHDEAQMPCGKFHQRDLSSTAKAAPKDSVPAVPAPHDAAARLPFCMIQLGPNDMGPHRTPVSARGLSSLATTTSISSTPQASSTTGNLWNTPTRDPPAHGTSSHRILPRAEISNPFSAPLAPHHIPLHQDQIAPHSSITPMTDVEQLMLPSQSQTATLELLCKPPPRGANPPAASLNPTLLILLSHNGVEDETLLNILAAHQSDLTHCCTDHGAAMALAAKRWDPLQLLRLQLSGFNSLEEYEEHSPFAQPLLDTQEQYPTSKPQLGMQAQQQPLTGLEQQPPVTTTPQLVQHQLQQEVSSVSSPCSQQKNAAAAAVAAADETPVPQQQQQQQQVLTPTPGIATSPWLGRAESAAAEPFTPDVELLDQLQQLQSTMMQDQLRLRFPLPDSVSLMGLPDPTGTIKEGYVVAFNDRPMELDGETDILVYRHPGISGTDIVKLKLQTPTEALLKVLGADFQGALFFSTQGKSSAAAQLSGGDHDGDNYVLIHNKLIVKQFQPSTYIPPSGAKDFLHAGMRTNLNQARLLPAAAPSPEVAAITEADQRPEAPTPKPSSAAGGQHTAVTGGGAMLASLRAAADLSSEQQSNIESRLTEYHQFCTVADHEMRVAYKLWETSACIYGVDHSHTKTLSWLYTQALDAPRSGFFHSISAPLKQKIVEPAWLKNLRVQGSPPPPLTNSGSIAPCDRPPGREKRKTPMHSASILFKTYQAAWDFQSSFESASQARNILHPTASLPPVVDQLLLRAGRQIISTSPHLHITLAQPSKPTIALSHPPPSKSHPSSSHTPASHLRHPSPMHLPTHGISERGPHVLLAEKLKQRWDAGSASVYSTLGAEDPGTKSYRRSKMEASRRQQIHLRTSLDMVAEKLAREAVEIAVEVGLDLGGADERWEMCMGPAGYGKVCQNRGGYDVSICPRNGCMASTGAERLALAAYMGACQLFEEHKLQVEGPGGTAVRGSSTAAASAALVAKNSRLVRKGAKGVEMVWRLFAPQLVGIQARVMKFVRGRPGTG